MRPQSVSAINVSYVAARTEVQQGGREATHSKQHPPGPSVHPLERPHAPSSLLPAGWCHGGRFRLLSGIDGVARAEVDADERPGPVRGPRSSRLPVAALGGSTAYHARPPHRPSCRPGECAAATGWLRCAEPSSPTPSPSAARPPWLAPLTVLLVRSCLGSTPGGDVPVGVPDGGLSR